MTLHSTWFTNQIHFFSQYFKNKNFEWWKQKWVRWYSRFALRCGVFTALARAGRTPTVKLFDPWASFWGAGPLEHAPSAEILRLNLVRTARGAHAERYPRCHAMQLWRQDQTWGSQGFQDVTSNYKERFLDIHFTIYKMAAVRADDTPTPACTKTLKRCSTDHMHHMHAWLMAGPGSSHEWHDQYGSTYGTLMFNLFVYACTGCYSF
jgi:hypothetical protein